MLNIANKAARKATARKAAATATPAANLPAIVPGAATASALPANGAPALPAANNGPAWLAKFAALPAVAQWLATPGSRAHKYGASAGLLPCANNLYTPTRLGAPMGVTGKGKSGKYTVHALVMAALAQAQKASGGNAQTAVCGAAIAYYMALQTPATANPAAPVTTPGVVLALLQPPHTKTAKYVGKAVAGVSTPCPQWLNGYINGMVGQHNGTKA